MTPTTATEVAQADEWYVYIVATEAGTLYTGITTDLARRMREHRSGARGARFFKLSAAVRMIYSERQASRSAALRREAEIKRMRRAQKFALIGPALPSP